MVDVLTSFSKISNYKNIISKKNAAYLALGEVSLTVRKSFSNLSNVEVGNVSKISILWTSSITNIWSLIAPEESVKFIQGKLEKSFKIILKSYRYMTTLETKRISKKAGEGKT